MVISCIIGAICLTLSWLIPLNLPNSLPSAEINVFNKDKYNP